MDAEIKVLFVEDRAEDAELLVRELRGAALQVDWRRVDNLTDLEAALGSFLPDVILSDYTLPGFGGMSALEVARRYLPDTPFIFVSGTIGEERAIEALRLGATDYVLKDSRARLAPAVVRAIRESRERRARHRAELERERSEERFRSIAEASQEWIWETDAAGVHTYSNRAVTTILGYPPEQLVGTRAVDYVDPEPQDALMALRAESVQNRTGWRDWLLCWRHRDGSPRWLESTGLPLFGSDGKLVGFRGANRDVTERIQQQQKISRLSRIHSVLSAINSHIVRVSERDDLFRESCRIAVEYGGFQVGWIGLVVPGQPGARLVVWSGGNQSDAEALASEPARASERPGPIAEAIEQRRAVPINDLEGDPRRLWRRAALERGYRAMIALPLMVDDEVAGVLALYSSEAQVFDQDELKLLRQLATDISFALHHIENRERLAYVTHYDLFTGLANRQLFLDRLTQTIGAAASRSDPVSVLVLDLMQFERINETLGRSAGDQLLKATVQRLRDVLDPAIMPARLSGARFGMAFDNLTASALAELLEHRILPALAVPLAIEGKEWRASFKAGIAMFPDHAGGAEDLCGQAEAALQRARELSESYAIYSATVNDSGAQRLHEENRLRKAVEKHEFVLHYQPKVDLVSGALQGLEALVRWRDPERGLVPPLAFIHLLEETGLIVEVGRSLVEQVVSDIRQWRAHGRVVPRVAVNVSQVQLRHKDFVAGMLAALGPDAAVAGVDIEVTESLVAQDLETNVAKLRQLREAGMQVAIDDFGTGYSSLSQIATLPLDSLKIDRAFVSQLGLRQESGVIVSTIINLAKALGIKVVAEGVETEEQARRLRAMGCDEAQGYLFSKPVPADEVLHQLKYDLGTEAPA